MSPAQQSQPFPLLFLPSQHPAASAVLPLPDPLHSPAAAPHHRKQPHSDCVAHFCFGCFDSLFPTSGSHSFCHFPVADWYSRRDSENPHPTLRQKRRHYPRKPAAPPRPAGCLSQQKHSLPAFLLRPTFPPASAGPAPTSAAGSAEWPPAPDS